jgi:hypothetical protein
MDADSDDDGLTDGEEVHIYSTSPTNAYFLSQQIFNTSLYTDYHLVDLTDADADDIPDRVEQYYNLSGTDPQDALRDLDDNGIDNRTQYAMGIALDADLALYDQDMDGMSDVFEDYYQLAKTFPGDAVLDPDGDGVMNHEEMVLLLSPQDADTHDQGGLGDMLALMLSVKFPSGGEPADDVDPANGLPDWADAALASPTAPDFFQFARLQSGDLDADGMPDTWEHQYSKLRHPVNGLLLRVNDAAEDNDADGLVNSYEYQIGTSPVAGDSDGNSVEDSDEDFDGDGLTNLQEYHLGTHALLFDTDGDGIGDGQEVAEGTDANDAASNSTVLLGLYFLPPVESAD